MNCFVDIGCSRRSRAIIAGARQIFFARMIPIGGDTSTARSRRRCASASKRRRCCGSSSPKQRTIAGQRNRAHQISAPEQSAEAVDAADPDNSFALLIARLDARRPAPHSPPLHATAVDRTPATVLLSERSAAIAGRRRRARESAQQARRRARISAAGITRRRSRTSRSIA